MSITVNLQPSCLTDELHRPAESAFWRRLHSASSHKLFICCTWLTLSSPVPWQNWIVAYLGYTLQMKTLFRGWPVMAHETHMRRRRRPDSQRTATEHFQSPLYGSGTVFRSIPHLLRHFPSSALAWRHTSSNSVARSYCCHARDLTLSFMDTLIALTYLLISCMYCVCVQAEAALSELQPLLSSPTDITVT